VSLIITMIVYPAELAQGRRHMIVHETLQWEDSSARPTSLDGFLTGSQKLATCLVRKNHRDNGKANLTPQKTRLVRSRSKIDFDSALNERPRSIMIEREAGGTKRPGGDPADDNWGPVDRHVVRKKKEKIGLRGSQAEQKSRLEGSREKRFIQVWDRKDRHDLKEVIQ